MSDLGNLHVYICECGAVSDNPSLEKRVPCGRRDDGWHDPHPAKYVPLFRAVEAEQRAEKLARFAFGDAPEWEKANTSQKHRIRELESECARLREGITKVAYNNATPKGTREWLRSLLAQPESTE